ncbi:ATP-grasp ribosomal peptide maturase [Streptomyces platensis]|uniref:ATP-grasp ribosomal peptide maturase n=1 Tax=Streptomyces platensis TaxID=58346 RepID=A0AAE6NMT9_STRPT|nr:ATP-grasp ribosomal peptide maturase [Streptomyces platensis]OSY45647.1 RimK-like ATP-grasp domain protein [Streptomyces platensis]QEV54351.1 ATP-grasp ribosomal peptide maturase [Streptomyces platensis]
MTGAGHVLILAGRFDPTCDLVVEELNRRAVPVFRADMAEFPLRLTLAASLSGSRWHGTLANDRRTLDLASVRSVYYRRPTHPKFPEQMAAEARTVAEREARWGFGGLLTALPCRWLPPPGRAADAEYKPRQLRVAADVGLSVPRTLITNDPYAAKDFAESLDGGPVIYKPFFPVRGTVRGQTAAVYASIIDPGDLPHADIASTAHMFQEWVPKAYEVRLTAVDGQIFAAEIHADSDAGRIDWRSDYDSHTYRVCDPPPEVATGVQRMLDRLGLPYGAFDFVVTPEGQWRFLEVNPSGQYGFIEQATGLRITAAICDYLEGAGQ